MNISFLCLQDGMVCGAGKNHTCCAPYWGQCVKDSHCCNHQHRCVHVAGFVYKRCIVPGTQWQCDTSVDAMADKLRPTGVIVLSTLIYLLIM